MKNNKGKIKKDKLEERMTVLMVTSYGGGKIYVRRVGKWVFMWDAVYKNELYSSHVVVKPRKGKKVLSKAEIEEITKILFAGGASTIDYQKGIKLSKTEKETVEMFEKARSTVSNLKPKANA